MSGGRWIIVDERKPVGADERYRGRSGWSDRVRSPFLTRDEAERVLGVFCGSLMDACAIRPVRPAGTKRARAAAQAAADATATLRTELDGLRATDDEMAARLAAVTAERDEARRDLAELRRAIEVLIAQARVSP